MLYLSLPSAKAIAPQMVGPMTGPFRLFLLLSLRSPQRSYASSQRGGADLADSSGRYHHFERASFIFPSSLLLGTWIYVAARQILFSFVARKSLRVAGKMRTEVFIFFLRTVVSLLLDFSVMDCIFPMPHVCLLPERLTL